MGNGFKECICSDGMHWVQSSLPGVGGWASANLARLERECKIMGDGAFCLGLQLATEPPVVEKLKQQKRPGIWAN